MKRSIIVKFLAIVLCAAFLLVGAGAALGVGMLASLGLYEKSVSEYRQEVELQRAYDFADSLIAAYASRTLGGCPEELVQDYYGLRYSYTDYYRNLLAYQILDADGTLLDYDGDLTGSWTEVECVSSYVVYLGDYEEPSAEEATGPHRTDDPTGTAHYDATEPVREYEGYVYGYYDPELQSHREVWLKTETSPVYTVRVLLTDQATDRAGMLLDLLQANLIGLLFLLAVFGSGLFILGGGLADHLAQGGHHILGGDHMVAAGADAVFGTPGSIDDHMVAGVVPDTVGIKKVDLLAGPELDVHHFHRTVGFCQNLFFHWLCSLYSMSLRGT